MRIMKLSKVFCVVLVLCYLLVVPSYAVKADNSNSQWLVVDNYSTVSGRMIAGEENTIKLYVKNTNSRNCFYNILISLEFMSSDVLPVEGKTNQIYVDSIEAGETRIVEIPVKVATGATGEKGIKLNMVYFNNEGRQRFENSTMLLFDVKRSAVGIDFISVDETDNVLRLEYYNASENDIYNTIIKVGGDVSSVVNYEVGNVAAKEKKQVDIPLNFITGGNHKIQVSCSYENKTGTAIQSDPESYMVKVSDDTIKNPEHDEKKVDDTIIDDVFSVQNILITSGLVIVVVACIRVMQNFADKKKNSDRRKANKI